MNPIIFTILAALGAIVSSAPAIAQECTLKINARLGIGRDAQARRLERLENLMTQKGYQIVESDHATYRLTVSGGGWACFQGRSWMEDAFAFPASYDFSFQGSGSDIQDHGDFKGFFAGLDARAGRKVRRQVQEIPDCHACRIFDYDAARALSLSQVTKRILQKRGYSLVNKREDANYEASERCSSAGDDDICALAVRKIGTDRHTSGDHREGRKSLMSSLLQELHRPRDDQHIKSCAEMELGN